jgi:hypothetical protein
VTPTPPSPALLFSWRAKERRGWRLFVLGLASLLFVGGVLLLFQVIYPPARPLTLTPQRIWLLDPSLPGARQIIASAADKDFLMLAPPATDATLPALTGQAPVFAPSFKGRTLHTKDFLETQTASSTLPRLFRPQTAMRPPRPPRAEPVIVEPPAYALKAVVTNGLKDRPIIRAVTLPATTLPAEKEVTFQVAVASTGLVKLVLPLTDAAAQSEAYRTLHPQLTNLRFAAKPDSTVEWGTVTFQWQEDQP